MDTLIRLLHLAKELFPLEVALTLGTAFFALSWIRPRSTVRLPSRKQAALPLFLWGIISALLVLGIGTATSWIAASDPMHVDWDAWRQRPLPLFVTAALLLTVVLPLRLAGTPAPGLRAITPRRSWWEFAPKPLLRITAITVMLGLLTAGWQILIGVSVPSDGNRYGIGSIPTDLPAFGRFQDGLGYYWGAGWPNHLLTLIAFLLCALALPLALGAGANRPAPVEALAADVRESREAAARTMTLVALGGVLVTLGAVWAFVGFVGEIIVGVDGLAASPGELVTVGTGYRDLARPLHWAGYIVQGIGAALLMRLVVDLLRSFVSGRRTEARAASDSALGIRGGAVRSESEQR